MIEMYQSLVKKSAQDKIIFKIIYCQEAHAEDEWRIGSRFKINQHKTIEDRKQATKMLLDEYDLLEYPNEIYLDKMDNEFQTLYSSWPTRYYLILNGKIEYVYYPKNATFTLDGIIKRIEELL
jgi:hypothetical protein